MKLLTRLLILLMTISFVACHSSKQIVTGERMLVKPPIMGWASWNNYRININEDIIKDNAKTMASNGMKEAGYQYINIDDGYFGGRDENGALLINDKFPNGMKAVADYIHSKQLKAGIYSEAGINTCGSHYDKDTIAVGCGLFGHDYQDLSKMLCQWGYDFIKVDWCGGQWLGLDEKMRYTAIGKLVKQLRPDAVFNICRWQYPGDWATEVADSWRISGDISAHFSSITRIIDLNANLWSKCTPGHYNDMDMLQVGRGMTYEEDKAHFTMWCMLVSPLLAGNDLTKMSQETLELLTNKDVIALNQDPLFYQARRIVDNGDFEIWAKPLSSVVSGKIAVVLLNRSKKDRKMILRPKLVGINSKKGYTMSDLWTKKEYSKSIAEERSFVVPKHGVVTLLLEGTSIPFNVFTNK